MGVMTSLFGQSDKRERPSNPSEQLLSLFGAGWDTAAGVDVTPDIALQVTAVFACVRVIAEGASQLPFVTFERKGREKFRAYTHSLFPILHDIANGEMTAMECREAITGHTALRGNGYAEIEYDNAGEVRGLWPLRPDKMTPRRVEGKLVYDYLMPSGQTVRLPAWRVFHLRGFGGDGVIGYNPIQLARESVALALGTEEFGARFFGNGARPASVLEHPGRLSEEAQTRLINKIEDRHQGLSKAHRLMVLEEGMKLHEVGLAPEDSQFLQTRNFQVIEIARLFNVQPHKIMALERSTNNNIEQQAMDFVTHTLGPYLIRWEQRVAMSLMTAAERQRYFVKHVVDALLRADTKSRYEAYGLGIQSGWLSRNEARELEDRNPLDGLDEPLQPLNMTTDVTGQNGDGKTQGRQLRILGGKAHEQRAAAAETVGKERRRLVDSQRGLIEDVAGRMVRRETGDIGRAVTKFLVRTNDVQGFLLWLGDFYTEHQGYVEKNMGPVFDSLSALTLESVARELGQAGLVDEAGAGMTEFSAAYVATLALRWAVGKRRQLEKLIGDGVTGDGQTMADVLQERLDGWAETEPEKVGRRESVRGVNAAAKAAYILGGVTLLRWVASGETCPYCQSLDGKVVGVDQYFVSAGEFAPDGAASPLLVRRSIGHPPVHDGCDCVVVAG